MRLYSAESLETLRSRRLLKDWTAEGLLTAAQYEQMEAETVSDLRTTNIFLRGVLFLFTLIVVAAATGLFSLMFVTSRSNSGQSFLFLMLGVLCYAAAEVIVFQSRLYHHGIEEALAVCSIGFLFVGLQFGRGPHAAKGDAAELLIPAACVLLSLWIWHHFGYWYTFLAAMLFTIPLAGYFTPSHAVQRGVLAVLSLAGLAGVAALRARHRVDSLGEGYALAEALLWSGLYLTLNLKILALDLPVRWWSFRGVERAGEFAGPFYWLTWVLIWCLPPIVLALGVRRKDRFVLGTGAILIIVTFISNKPYLGWQRYTWDPMLLGVFLTGAVFVVRRWLARGPGAFGRVSPLRG